MGDEIPIPDRLEQAVGKPEGENVLRGFFAEKMIDPEDLILAEHFMQLGIELHGAA